MPVPAPSSQPRLPDAAADWPELRPTVLAELWSIDGTGDTLRSLADLYLRDGPGHLDRLTAAVEGGDVGEVREAAHAMKGAASIFGADGLMGRAAAIENDAVAGCLPDAGAVAELSDEAHRVDGRLEQILRTADDPGAAVGTADGTADESAERRPEIGPHPGGGR